MNSRGLFKDQIHADANSSFLCLLIFAYKVHDGTITRLRNYRIWKLPYHTVFPTGLHNCTEVVILGVVRSGTLFANIYLGIL